MVCNEKLDWSPATILPENVKLYFSGKIQLGDQSVSLIYALPHINPEYGNVCTPPQKLVVLGGFFEVIHQTIYLNGINIL